MSLPEGFILDRPSAMEFKEMECEIVRVPSELTLGESLLLALNIAGHSTEPLRVLHGDTYIRDIPAGNDVVGIAESPDQYNWKFSNLPSRSQPLVWCGYFSFSDASAFIRMLATARGDFVAAVDAYARQMNTRSVKIDSWMDAGHLRTYFRAREKFTTERSFNSLKIGGGLVTKTGNPPSKILGEGNWFQNLPVDLKIYSPQLISMSSDSPEYTIEYLPMPPLNELYVHGGLPRHAWETIFTYCDAWLRKAYRPEHHSSQLEESRFGLLVDKTRDRMQQINDQLSLNTSLPVVFNGRQTSSFDAMAQTCIEIALVSPIVPGILHGDFCFSNLIYDSRGGRIRVIDPRGIQGGNSSEAVGDISYDLAKLAHSAVGKYDLLIADRFRVGFDKMANSFDLEIFDTPIHEDISKAFRSRDFPNFDSKCRLGVIATMVLLFISMVPLHADAPVRQYGFLANAARLYTEHLEGSL